MKSGQNVWHMKALAIPVAEATSAAAAEKEEEVVK